MTRYTIIMTGTKNGAGLLLSFFMLLDRKRILLAFCVAIAALISQADYRVGGQDVAPVVSQSGERRAVL